MPVKLAGKVPTAMNVFACRVVTMEHVVMHLNANAYKVGEDHSVIFPYVKTATMVTVTLQINVSAMMDGLETIVQNVHP